MTFLINEMIQIYVVFFQVISRKFDGNNFQSFDQ